MDLELSSLLTILLANAFVILSVLAFLALFHKWTAGREPKTYDSFAENLVIGDGASQIESLLAKDD